MDQVPTTQPIAFHVEESSFFSKYWKTLVIIPLILLMVLVLNYLNILTLSLLSPKILGFLPHKQFNQTFGTYLQANTNTQPTVLPFVCPVKKELCKTGESINITQTIPPFIGLAYDNLASGSAVLAITAGKYNSGVSIDNNDNKTTVLTILDDVKNVEVDYQFKGIAYTPMGSGRGSVKPGDTIGWVSNQKLDKGLMSKQYSLIVSVQYLKTKTFINLDIVELLKNTH